MTITRRGFFGRLAAIGVVVSAPVRALLPNAWTTIEPHALGSLGAPPVVVTDRETGIAIRFIRQYDIDADRSPVRRDLWFHPDAFEMVMSPLEADRIGVWHAYQRRPVPDPIFPPTAASTQAKRT